ncbi:MAG TPA: metal ABC transporter ATP-binding protein [Candidatus Baltobacteraceae bacterium]|nr:metal ABC transporter ATP-binding protein [Candidatus Baltobacteraceae bacterium]
MKPSNPPALEIHGLTYAHGGVPILNDVDFVLKQGEYLAVIGPNGGGKTTLVKLLLGILKPSKGSISVFGRSLADHDARADIGYVPQRISGTALEFPATVRELVESGRTPRRGILSSWKKADQDAVAHALETLGIAHLADRVIGTLSGGERQRAFVARALAAEPRILVLDEPTVGVDAAAQESFRSFLMHANRDHGMTIVFVTHDVDFISRDATSVLCLNHAMVCHGRPGQYLKEDFLIKLYGREVKLVEHEHHRH